MLHPVCRVNPQPVGQFTKTKAVGAGGGPGSDRLNRLLITRPYIFLVLVHCFCFSWTWLSKIGSQVHLGDPGLADALENPGINQEILRFAIVARLSNDCLGILRLVPAVFPSPAQFMIQIRPSSFCPLPPCSLFSLFIACSSSRQKDLPFFVVCVLCSFRVLTI